jgi:flagellar hook-associated protein 3 FlgL
MRITPISTMASSNSLRSSIREIQNEMLRAQKEVATGKLADYGETLGFRSRELTSAKRMIEQIGSVVDTNALAQSRLDITQDGVGRIAEFVRQLSSGMTASMSQTTGRGTIVTTARQALAGIEDVLNSSFNGEYIFSGINSDSKVTDGFANSAANAALDASFLTYFGFDKNDPAAAFIDQAAMRDFLDNVVAPQFFGTDWTANYSNATDAGISARITLIQVETVSVSANERGFRGSVMAAAIASELFDSNIGQGGLLAVSEKAIEVGGQALGDLADTQGRAGVAQDQLARATIRLEAQSVILQERAASMENIDQYGASTQLNMLLTQLEISFSLTSRIQQLSIMRFLQ